MITQEQIEFLNIRAVRFFEKGGNAVHAVLV